MTKFDLEDLTPMTAEEMAFGELEDCMLTLDVVGKQIEAGLRDAALSTLGVVGKLKNK